MQVEIDHVGVVVNDLERAMKFFETLFGWKMPESGPYSKILSVDLLGYRIRYAMLRTPNTYFEIVEPKEGPWFDDLQKHGEGYIREICVNVDDVEKFSEKINALGLTPMDRFLNPIKEKHDVAPSGAKFVYHRSEKIFGTLLEFISRK